MTSIELKKVSLSNGETLGYRERSGGDKVVLLVHGNMISSKHWDVVMENFHPSYKVVAVDLRGFGISTYLSPIESIKDFADDLKLFVDSLGLRDFVLVGWSMGGGVAMQYAADHSEDLDRLILLASLSTRGFPYMGALEVDLPPRRLVNREEIANDVIKSIPITNAYRTRNKDLLRMIWDRFIYTHNRPSEDQYEAYLEDMLTQRPECLIDAYHVNNIFNISHTDNGLAAGTGEADNIRIPTLILWGQNDIVTTEKVAREIQEDIGDNVEIICLENCGHSPLIDDLDQLLARMSEFIESK